MRNQNKLEVSYSNNTVTVQGDSVQKGLFLETLVRKGFKFSLHFIIMKMIITCPTMAAAVSSYNTWTPFMRNAAIEIYVKNEDEGRKFCQQFEDISTKIAHETNNPKPVNQGVYLGNLSDGFTFMATTALASFVLGIGLHYLSKAIREHQPNPAYVIGAFMVMLGAIYACGSVPIIVPNMAALATAYACTKFLTPRIIAMDDGCKKLATSAIGFLLPAVASGIAAIPIYSSAAEAAIATVGIFIGSQTAHLATSWRDRVAIQAPPSTVTAVAM